MTRALAGLIAFALFCTIVAVVQCILLNDWRHYFVYVLLDVLLMSALVTMFIFFIRCVNGVWVWEE